MGMVISLTSLLKKKYSSRRIIVAREQMVKVATLYYRVFPTQIPKGMHPMTPPTMNATPKFGESVSLNPTALATSTVIVPIALKTPTL